MVNSKKMSKSTVAIVLLSLLLVLSLILTATGAWFTSTGSKDGQTTIEFGKVAVSVDGTATFTKDHADVKTVDGCKWTISGLSFTNTSNVRVYYAYTVAVDMEGLTEEEKAYFIIPAGSTVEVKELAADGTIDEINDLVVTFQSKGAMNGSAKTGTLKITVKVAAVQADHNDETAAKTQLAQLLAGTDINA